MPTIKQKRAFKEITENHRSISGAMRDVGYEHNTAKKPQNLTESKGWKELMDEYMPDSELARVHKEGLNASDKVIKDGEVLLEKPDYAVRHKYLDSAYKLKGSYAPEKTSSLNVIVGLKNVENEAELQELAIKVREKMREDYSKENIT